MAPTYQYTLSLRDQVSGPMRVITGSSAETTAKLTQLTQKNKALQASTKDLGGSMSVLRQRIDLLRSEKELLNPKNLTQIKQYNREIGSLTRQVDRLDNAGSGGKLTRYFSQLGGAIGGIVTNPLALIGAGLGFAGKLGVNFDQEMAKVNITAQLDERGLDDLKARVKAIAAKNKIDYTIAPTGLEQIISQVGDVDTSISILDSTLKGSKAAFAGVDVVAGALAQTLSSVGKENANAADILDTFFAAKRVGAGEFKDFAQYLPSLINGAKALGIEYKEVAGNFAYLTGKGMRADQASVYMSNMYSMLGRADVQKKLGANGIKIFDNGQMRSSLDIFTDLKAKFDSFGQDDQKRGALLEAVGIVDKEAKSAFIAMADDTDKLRTSLEACANASGETDRALALSANTAQRAAELFANFKGKIATLGEALLPTINGGIVVLGGALDATAAIVGGVTSACGWFFDELSDGNPLIAGLTTAIAAAGAVMLIHTVRLKAVSAWSAITTLASGVLSKAMLAANATMLATPWGIALVGAMALVGAITAMSVRTDKATRSFAAFNVETARAKSEANDYFAAAKNAAMGSDARAEAIRNINERYGEYLPNQLSERANNEDIARSLTLVNSELERKIRIKFESQAKEAALEAFDAQKAALYEWVAAEAPRDQQRQALADLTQMLPGMLDGTASMRAVQDHFKNRYDIGGMFDFGTWGGGAGMTWDGETYNSLGNKLLETMAAFRQQQQSLEIIAMRYAEAPPSKIAFTLPAFLGAQNPYGASAIIQPAGGAPLNDSAPGPSTKPLGVQSPPNKPITPQVAPAEIVGSVGAKSKNASKDIFDLDKATANEKGSSSYGAIVSKIGRVKMASLAAAGIAGVTMTSPAPVPPADSTTDYTSSTPTGEIIEHDKPKTPTLSLDKFGDKMASLTADGIAGFAMTTPAPGRSADSPIDYTTSIPTGEITDHDRLKTPTFSLDKFGDKMSSLAADGIASVAMASPAYGLSTYAPIDYTTSIPTGDITDYDRLKTPTLSLDKFGDKMASLAAAGIAGVAMTSPASGLSTDSPTDYATSIPTGDITDHDRPRTSTLSLDKFCDKIEIHIANADGKGYDQIRTEIIKVLKEIADGRS